MVVKNGALYYTNRPSSHHPGEQRESYRGFLKNNWHDGDLDYSVRTEKARILIRRPCQSACSGLFLGSLSHSRDWDWGDHHGGEVRFFPQTFTEQSGTFSQLFYSFARKTTKFEAYIAPSQSASATLLVSSFHVQRNQDSMSVWECGELACRYRPKFLGSLTGDLYNLPQTFTSNTGIFKIVFVAHSSSPGFVANWTSKCQSGFYLDKGCSCVKCVRGSYSRSPGMLFLREHFLQLVLSESPFTLQLILVAFRGCAGTSVCSLCAPGSFNKFYGWHLSPCLHD